MSQRIEYRVVWKREGRQRSTRIYQSWNAAYRKAQGILALEAVKSETTMDTLPALEQRPTIETRPVGDWSEHDYPTITITTTQAHHKRGISAKIKLPDEAA